MQLLWFEFGALTLLASLLVGIWARRLWWQSRLENKVAWPPGHGFDATLVKQRLDHLRQDPDAVAALRPRKTPGHDLFVSTVRRSLTQLSYFRSVPAATSEVVDRDAGEGHA
jgi:hypothetical protein